MLPASWNSIETFEISKKSTTKNLIILFMGENFLLILFHCEVVFQFPSVFHKFGSPYKIFYIVFHSQVFQPSKLLF